MSRKIGFGKGQKLLIFGNSLSQGFVHDPCVPHSTKFRKAARGIVSWCGGFWFVSHLTRRLRYVGGISALGSPIKMLISKVFVVGN